MQTSTMMKPNLSVLSTLAAIRLQRLLSDLWKKMYAYSTELHLVLLHCRLRKKVFYSRHLTIETKVKVYNQCLMPLLLDGGEAWTLYQPQIVLRKTTHHSAAHEIHHEHQMESLYVSNEEVLQKASVTDIELKLVSSRLR